VYVCVCVCGVCVCVCVAGGTTVVIVGTVLLVGGLACWMGYKRRAQLLRPCFGGDNGGGAGASVRSPATRTVSGGDRYELTPMRHHSIQDNDEDDLADELVLEIPDVDVETEPGRPAKLGTPIEPWDDDDWEEDQ